MHRKAGRFAFAMMVVDVGLVFTVAFVPGFLAALIACAASPWALALRHPVHGAGVPGGE